MPPVIGALAAAAPVAFGFSTFFGVGGLTGALLAGVSSLALSGVSSLLASKPNSSNLGGLDGGLTSPIRQPITARRMVYGELRASGAYAFVGSSSSNYYFHFVIMLASHKIESIDEVIVGEDSITPDMIDVNGNVVSGKYANRAILKFHEGSEGQLAEQGMIDSFPEWTENHRLRGIAYIYGRFQYDRNVFPTGIPKVSAWFKGKKDVYDPRTLSSKWTRNATLIQRDYIVDQSLGLGASEDTIDDAFTIASANVCDEFVQCAAVAHTVSAVATTTDLISITETALEFQTGDRVQVSSTGTIPSGISAGTNYFVIIYQRGGGTPRIRLASSFENAMAGTAINITSAGSGTITITKNAEPRYSADGAIDSDNDPEQVLNSLMTASAGDFIDAGGKYRLKAGYYSAPTIEFTESDIVGGITIQTKTTRRERFNRVIGTYISPLNNGVPADYPAVKNSYYAAEDGRVIDKPFPQAFTARPCQAQRAAKVILEKSRQEIVFSSNFKLTGFKVQAGDNVMITLPRYGWNQKVFQVLTWENSTQTIDDVPTPVLYMQFKEVASTECDWLLGEETAIDHAPNISLPYYKTVESVSGLRFDSTFVSSTGTALVYKVVLSWDAHPNAFVVEDGYFEIQYKTSAETAFKPSFFVDGAMTSSEVFTASPETAYDLRIRAVNGLGVYSGWQTIAGVSAGSSGGVTATDDYGAFVGDAVSTTDDWGTFVGDAVTTSDDYGGFV